MESNIAQLYGIDYFSEENSTPYNNAPHTTYSHNLENTQFQEYGCPQSEQYTGYNPVLQQSNLYEYSRICNWEYGQPCPIPDDVILNLDIISLRKLLTSLGSTSLMEAKVKLHRRKLLSRIYSVKSRNKTKQSINELELIRNALETEKQQLNGEINKYNNEISNLNN